MMGISFAGGLSIVAASRTSLRDRVAFVMSFGGHGDLPRTLRYLCTGIQPDGEQRPPHDYGVAIILLSVAEQVVPAGSSRAAAHGDPDLPRRIAARHGRQERNRRPNSSMRARSPHALPEPSKTLMRYVNERDVAHLGPILLPHVTQLGDDRMLSPGREAAPRAPCTCSTAPTTT